MIYQRFLRSDPTKESPCFTLPMYLWYQVFDTKTISQIRRPIRNWQHIVQQEIPYIDEDAR